MPRKKNDVRRPKESANAKRRNENCRYRLLVETTRDLIWELDQDGVYTYVSPAAKELLGYDPEEMLGKTPFEHLPPDEARRVRTLFEGYVATREGPLRLEVARLHKDGRPLVHETNVSPILDADGRLRGLCGISRDVTERKEMEEALEEEHQSLNRLLDARERERQIVAYEIHDGLAQKLTMAIMHYQMYKHARHDDLDESGKLCDTIGDLLNQCLAETRHLIAGLRPPILEECGVEAAIQHMLTESRCQAGAEVSFVSHGEFPRLDPVLENAAYRVAQEGLSNALRHSRSEKVQIELTQNNDRVQVAVHDWGRGFDPQNIDERCFGLAGVRERARLLGGTVTVTTTLGEGTRMVVEFPIALGETDT